MESERCSRRDPKRAQLRSQRDPSWSRINMLLLALRYGVHVQGAVGGFQKPRTSPQLVNSQRWNGDSVLQLQRTEFSHQLEQTWTRFSLTASSIKGSSSANVLIPVLGHLEQRNQLNCTVARLQAHRNRLFPKELNSSKRWLVMVTMGTGRKWNSIFKVLRKKKSPR